MDCLCLGLITLDSCVIFRVALKLDFGDCESLFCLCFIVDMKNDGLSLKFAEANEASHILFVPDVLSQIRTNLIICEEGVTCRYLYNMSALQLSGWPLVPKTNFFLFISNYFCYSLQWPLYERSCFHVRSNYCNCFFCELQPVASCAMPVMKGWRIKTNSPATKKARYVCL